MSYFHPVTGFPPDILLDYLERATATVSKEVNFKRLYYFGQIE